MPTRLLREGILSSDKVDQLDWPAEVFYRRLMSKVDDHGLFDARPSVLRASLYPLRLDRVREADITRWMATCQKAGLIALYSAGGKPYLWMLNTGWQTRSEAKYPLPDENTRKQLLSVGHLVVDEVVVVDEVKPLSAGADRFPEFWNIWPKSQRKQSKPKCHQVWKRKSLDAKADAILAHVKVMAASESWRGGFDPAPLTYLNQERWEGAEMDAPQLGSKPWFINGWNSIVTKGQEFSLKENDFESPPEFRAAVLKAAGITPEMVKQAEAMAK